MNPSAPIGVFDSGVGGLSVLRAIRAALPHEHLCYVADSGHVPYGTKTPEYLHVRALALTRFLLASDAKALVIACNTATLAAVAHLRVTFSVPIVAVEPAVRCAVAVTKTGIVGGGSATAATLASAQFSLLLERFGASVTILTQACPHLARASRGWRSHQSNNACTNSAIYGTTTGSRRRHACAWLHALSLPPPTD